MGTLINFEQAKSRDLIYRICKNIRDAKNRKARKKFFSWFWQMAEKKKINKVKKSELKKLIADIKNLIEDYRNREKKNETRTKS